MKFNQQTDWHVKDVKKDEMPTLPKFYDPAWQVEALDCSNMPLVYEGLDNIRHLDNLKWLSLESCPHVDDWFLDRIAGEFSHSLRYLNIKDCKKVTATGVACLAKISTLETLVLGGQTLRSGDLELVCLMLEDVLPKLEIRGIVYCDEGLLESQRKKNDQLAKQQQSEVDLLKVDLRQFLQEEHVKSLSSNQ